MRTPLTPVTRPVIATVTASLGAWATLGGVIDGDPLSPTTAVRVAVTMAVAVLVIALAVPAMTARPALPTEVSSSADARRAGVLKARAVGWLVAVTVPLAVPLAVLAEGRTALLVLIVCMTPAGAIATLATWRAVGGGRGVVQPSAVHGVVVLAGAVTGSWMTAWWTLIVGEHLSVGNPASATFGALAIAGIGLAGLVGGAIIYYWPADDTTSNRTAETVRPTPLTTRLHEAGRLDSHTWTALEIDGRTPSLRLVSWRQIDDVEGIPAVEIVVVRDDDTAHDPDWSAVSRWVGRRIAETSRTGRRHSLIVVDEAPPAQQKQSSKYASARGGRGDRK